MNSLLSGFSGGAFPLGLHTQEQAMFVFNRSVFAVLAPLALLIAVVLISNLTVESATPADAQLTAPAAPSTVAKLEQPRQKEGS
jgi:hypothetical protein